MTRNRRDNKVSVHGSGQNGVGWNKLKHWSTSWTGSVLFCLTSFHVLQRWRRLLRLHCLLVKKKIVENIYILNYKTMFWRDFWRLWSSYLVTVMGLVTPWSVTLALLEAYSIIVQRLPLQATVLSVIVSGDLVSSLYFSMCM